MAYSLLVGGKRREQEFMKRSQAFREAKKISESLLFASVDIVTGRGHIATFKRGKIIYRMDGKKQSERWL